MGNYEKLRVWQLGKDLAVDIYKVTRESESLKNDYGLKDQMQRAAVSVPSNIAEGEVSGSLKNSLRYLHIALGSLAELKTQLIIAGEINYLTNEKTVFEVKKVVDLEVKIRNLIKARQS